MKPITELKITKSQIQKLADNLQSLMKIKNVSESDISEKLNVPIMTVRRIVSGETIDPRISTLKLLADYFDVPVDSLIEDNKSRLISITSQHIPQFIPILDWKTASNINSIQYLDLHSWKEWQPVVLGNGSSLSSLAFALESRPSMQPRFPIGTLFIVDPKELPTDGDIILVKLKTNSDLSLRELSIDLPKWQLHPVITGSQTIFYDEKQHIIIGIVVLTMLYKRKNI